MDLHIDARGDSTIEENYLPDPNPGPDSKPASDLQELDGKL